MERGKGELRGGGGIREGSGKQRQRKGNKVVGHSTEDTMYSLNLFYKGQDGQEISMQSQIVSFESPPFPTLLLLIFT